MSVGMKMVVYFMQPYQHLGDCIDAAGIESDELSKEQEKLGRIFDGLSSLRIAGASKVEESRAVFENMKQVDWIDMQEHGEVLRNNLTSARFVHPMDF